MAVAQAPAGRTLDAARRSTTPISSIVCSRASIRCTSRLWHPNQRRTPSRGISYVYCDLRDLPLRDAFYDTVISLSTLEHVGMDDEHYGSDGRPRE